MKKSLSYLFILPFIAGIYIWFAAASPLFVDEGTIVAAAYSLGIPNPPGFPSYLIIAHLFSLFPLGSILERVQLVSVVSAMGVLAMLGLFLSRLIKVKPVVALVSMLALAFSYQFWSQAQNSESYIFSLVLIAGLLWILGSTNPARPGFKKRLFVGGAVFGLGLGANPIILHLLPLLLVVVAKWWKYIGLNNLLKLVGFISIIFVLVYAYLPLRAQTKPFINWNNPRTLTGIVNHLSGSNLNVYDPDRGIANGFTGSPLIMARSLGRYFYLLILQFSPVLLPLVIWGGINLFRKHRDLFYGSLLVLLTNFLLGVIYFSGDQENWYLVSYLILAFWLGVGMQELTQKFKLKHRGYAALIVLMGLLPFLWWGRSLYRSEQKLTDQYMEDLVLPMEGKGVVFGVGDAFHSLSNYQYVVKNKKEVLPILINHWQEYDWYRENLGIEAKDLVPLEAQGMALEDYIDWLLAKEIPVYITPLALRMSDWGQKYSLVRTGLAYRVLPLGSPDMFNESWWDYSLNQSGSLAVRATYLERTQRGNEAFIRQEYAASYIDLARKLRATDNNKATVYLARAEAVAADQGRTMNELGTYWAEVDDLKAAKKYLESALSLEPLFFAARLNLIQVLIAEKEYDQAKREIEIGEALFDKDFEREVLAVWRNQIENQELTVPQPER